MRRVPVVYLVFDVLYAGGELLLECPLRERMRILDELLAATRIHHGGTEGHRGNQGGQGKLIAWGEGEATSLCG